MWIEVYSMGVKLSWDGEVVLSLIWFLKLGLGFGSLVEKRKISDC